MAAVELGGCGKGRNDLYKTVILLVFTELKQCEENIVVVECHCNIMTIVTVLNTGIAFEPGL